jgi:hypothetical protein
VIYSLAIRLAASRALHGNTSAGTRVYDSAISAIDELIADDPVPVIIISTEEESATITGRDILAGSRKNQFVVEVALASALERTIQTEDGGTTTETVVVIPHTDAGLEISIAIISRQIMRALFGRETVWSRVFCDLIGEVDKFAAKRGAGAVKDGTKFAARQMTFDFSPYAEPAFGKEPMSGTPLAAFFAALEGDPSVARFGPPLMQAIVGDAVPDWRVFYAQMGMSDEEAEKVGLYPVLDNAGALVPVSDVDYGSDLGPINQDAVDQFLPPEP